MAELPPSRERVSDTERDAAIGTLREHAVAGRLTLEEFSERVDVALAARTGVDLEVAVAELPSRPEATASRKRRFLITLVGSEQRRGRWRVPERLWAFSLLGAPDLDLRQAVIDRPEVTVTSISLVGALTALVPPAIDVELGGLALIGGNDLFGEEPAVEIPFGPRIRIRSFALVGGARVTRVRRSAELETGESA
jgi:uncharacterized protein DUF1707